MSSKKVLLCLLVLGLVASAQSVGGGDVKAIASRVDARYNRMRTLTAEFTELYSGAGVTRQESGTLTLKRSGKMRWEFVQPKEKLFVSDGKTAYFYVPAERQVRRAAVKKLDDFHSPIRYLLGRSRLNSEFQDLRVEASEKPWRAGNVVLAGVPKHLSDRVERVLLEISPGSIIERIVIFEVDGSATEFRFSKVVEDAPVADEYFRFRVPSGVETIEADELTGR
jgi:outer membrane lipoprotein carrier protein